MYSLSELFYDAKGICGNRENLFTITSAITSTRTSWIYPVIKGGTGFAVGNCFGAVGTPRAGTILTKGR